MKLLRLNPTHRKKRDEWGTRSHTLPPFPYPQTNLQIAS